MKILELRFKNLNSLYGEWLIDFTAPEYTSEGIFALTGPTGSGKSTILDAICLALYGATPRLGKISISSNEIMSRHTGECFAEVLFRSQSGLFRCSWYQHRARKKSEGELQQPRHEISESDGRLIESKIRDVAVHVEEKTGMNFERFTRSMMLAQGAFDSFLKAGTEDKSRILEQITGTEIYTEISKRVHERKRREQSDLERIKVEMAATEILEPEEKEQIKKALEEKKKELEKLRKEKEKTEKALNWLINVKKLREEIETLSKRNSEIENERKEFSFKHEKLKKAEKAAELEDLYSQIQSMRNQQKQDRSNFVEKSSKMENLKLMIEKKLEELQKIREFEKKLKKEKEKTAPLIKKVRLLDQKLSEMEQRKNEIEKVQIKENKKICDLRKKIKSEELFRKKIEKNIEKITEYLHEKRETQWLAENFTGIKEKVKNIRSLKNDVMILEKKTKEASELYMKTKKELRKQTEKLFEKKEISEKLKEKIRKRKKDLETFLENRMLREYRNERDSLFREMAFLKKIETLEAERSRLKEGSPCPLCGSEKHPFALGNVPEKNRTEKRIEKLDVLIDKAENMRSEIEELEKKEEKTSENLRENENLISDLKGKKRSDEKNLENRSEIFEKTEENMKKKKEALQKNLGSHGFVFNRNNLLKTMELLESEVKKWYEYKNEKNEKEKEKIELDSEIKSKKVALEIHLESEKKYEEALKDIVEKYEFEKNKREQLFGHKNPDEEEQQLDESCEKAEFNEKRAAESYKNTKKELEIIKTERSILQENIEKRTAELEKLEGKLSKKLFNADFRDEKEFVNSRLSPSEIEKLSKKARELDEKKQETQTRKKDREETLKAEKSKKITDADSGELKKTKELYLKNIEETEEKAAALRHRIKENSEAEKNMKEKQNLLNQKKETYLLWSKLYDLIGSADGKKYRVFAQGVTFDFMISHANRQLEKMTDRYLLIRDDIEPLELNVIDNYQAGEIRSAKNLSGGESFLVSLSLALGLSHMASRKVRIDSLFLDEGFGTLDEEALEIALDNLSSLYKEGKLIGIISHVSALRERIGTQIKIIPFSGGKSVIRGPGVSKK